VEILTEDQNSAFAPECLAPLRAIYVPGAQGTRSVTSSTTITHRFVRVDRSRHNVPLRFCELYLMFVFGSVACLAFIGIGFSLNAKLAFSSGSRTAEVDQQRLLGV
jgi:hypothetical protein